MAVKKKDRARKRRRETTAELSARLAPLEEVERTQTNGDKQNEGDIIVNRDSFKLPEGLIEDEAAQNNGFWLDPVVIVILLLALLFIGFIAYLISKMPNTP